MIALAALAAMLGGCGGRDKAQAPTERVRVERPKPLSVRDPQAFHDNVGSAMAEVPPASRPDFQRALTCTLSTAAQSGSPRALDAALVREINARIRAGASPEEFCQQPQQAQPQTPQQTQQQ